MECWIRSPQATFRWANAFDAADLGTKPGGASEGDDRRRRQSAVRQSASEESHNHRHMPSTGPILSWLSVGEYGFKLSHWERMNIYGKLSDFTPERMLVNCRSND